MDVEQELSRAKHIDFVAQASPEVVRRTPPATGLDLAEADMAKGEPDAAGALAQKALEDPNQAGRANFILARAAILHGDVAAAQRYFQEAVRLSRDPRTVAWSHIYLGRIDDVQNQRELAMTEYRAALTARDGQPDTKRAAEKGLQQAYTVPQTVHTAPENGDSIPPDQPSPPSPPQPHRQ
jgi:tetratricopeptide (TPR) repeat protein